MIDETLYPCLNLALTLESEQERIIFLLHAAKAINADMECLNLFFMIKAMPGNSWITNREIPVENLEQDYKNYKVEHCTDLLQDFPEDCKKICTLCQYSSRFANYRIKSEQFIISALLNNKALYEKKSLALKPANFKAGFLFIVEQHFFLIPLYHLFFQYIQGCSTLEVPDNPLLDNLATPGWERIIDAFLYSSTFKRGVKWPAISGIIQSQLLPAIKESLLILKPHTVVSLPEFEDHVKVMLTRKKYMPLEFGTTNKEKQLKTPVNSPPTLLEEAAPMLSAPPVGNLDDNPDFADLSISTSDGETISGELLQGLCSPMELPRPSNQPERITEISSLDAPPVPKPKPTPITVGDSTTHQCCGFNLGQLIDVHGRYDISQLMEQHLILSFNPEMLHGYLYDAYISGQVSIDCALCNGIEGFLLFVPGHGAAIWIQKEKVHGIYLLKSLFSDTSIRKITWNLPELIALCYERDIQYPKELYSLTAAYCAAVSSAPLFPLLPIMAYGTLDLSSPAAFLHFLSAYHIIYSIMEKEACKKNGYKSLRIWDAYERALATAVSLHPQFAGNRNLSRIGLMENEFIFNPCCHKIMHGSCVCITIVVDSIEQKRLLEDKTVKMSILASLFLTPELSAFDLKLLSYRDNQLSLFLNTRGKSTLHFLEGLIGRVIAKTLRASHYPPPTLTISYS